MPDATPRLRIEEAVPLAEALVAHVVAGDGGRFLVLKGRGAVHHGARGARWGSDVDVLVPPDAWAALAAGLDARGWRRRTADPDEATFPTHSVSFYHPLWPCDIDAHFRFPGLERPAGEVFDALWERHVTIPGARRDVPVPDRADTVVILAVHALRSPWVDRHRRELVDLRAVIPQVGEERVLASARRLGALATIRPFLEPLLTSTPGSLEWGQVSEEWAVRTRVSDPLARRLETMRRAGRRERSAILRLALLPPREIFEKDSLDAPRHGLPLVGAYVRRWARGLLALPRAVAQVRRLRRESLLPPDSGA